MAVGATVLGHREDEAVARLTKELRAFDGSVKPGDIVLSGFLGGAAPVRQGDEFVIEAHGQPPHDVVP